MAIPYQAAPADEQPEVIKATKARGASWGRHILWVLIISTALAAIALLGSWALGTRAIEGPGGQSRVAQPPPVADTVQVTPKMNDTNPATPGN